MQDYNHKARRGTNAFTFTELRIIHVFTVGCLTFAQILLPLQTVNDFLWHHHHWMEWFWPTIEINGFSMVLGSGNHWKRRFSMVFTIGPTMEWLLTIVEVYPLVFVFHFANQCNLHLSPFCTSPFSWKYNVAFTIMYSNKF